MRLLLALAFLWAQFGMNHGFSCQVTSDRCIFPSPETDEYMCINNPPIFGNESELSGHYFCSTRPTEEGLAWARCDSGCFDESARPIEFAGEMASMSVMCRTVPENCQFPFAFKGVTYHKCTNTLLSSSEASSEEAFLWCATKTDDKGNMLEGMWGKCDLATCQKDDSSGEEAAAGDSQVIYAEVTIVAESNEANVSATITLEQSSAQDPLRIHGQVYGLPPGRHGFHVHEHADTSDQCKAAGAHFNPHNVFHGSPDSDVRHAGDFGNIEADSDGVATFDFRILQGSSLFGENTLIGRTLVIHEDPDDLGLNPDEGSKAVGNAGARLACGIIVQREGLSQWNLTLIIIIVLAVIIALLLLLISALICYCCRKKRQISSEKGEEGVPFQNGDMKKKPLYDELSIPFIDASPTPTPKVGRSTERLSFFNRTPSIGRSRGSLSNDLDNTKA